MTRRSASVNKSSGGTRYKPSTDDGMKKPLLDVKPALKPPADKKADTVAGRLKIYKDRDGIPVLYDKTAHTRSELSKDAIKVLWHDVFSPITLIKGYTSTLRRFNDFITEKQREEYLQGIDTATKRLVFVLEKLRYITGLEEMRNISMQSTVLVDLLRKICSDTQERDTKHIISFRPRPSIPKVKINRESIEQVLHNLLDNAIKYSPNGGDIDVEVMTVGNIQELNRFFPDAPRIKLPAVIVSVIDNGSGFPDNEREKVFEKLYRVDCPLTRSVPGLGLGLYINKVTVEAHGGSIWARKRVQEGSIFSFSLPV
jgi:signal transduction histidine kinase